MKSGVSIHHHMVPLRVLGNAHVTGVEFDRDGETVVIDADVVFKAIGQKFDGDGIVGALNIENGRIVVDENQATSVAGIWAGGDCVVGGDDLTVSAVQHGKVAAIAIDRHLRA